MNGRFTASRLAVAVGVGCIAILMSKLFALGTDFVFPWSAARALVCGESAYSISEFLYPLPAALVALPFLSLPPHAANLAFIGLSAAVLTWALTAEGWPRLIALTSPPFLLSVLFGQWPPAIMAASFLPALGWLAAVKPNLGLVVIAYRPSRAVLVGAAAILVMSFTVLPKWPLEWLVHLRERQRTPHLPALLWPFGFLGLLGLLRWRTREGRALAAMTLVPASAVPYDYLMLWLCARTARESGILTVCAWAGFAILAATAPHDLTRSTTWGHFITTITLIGPAVWMVLRRPNQCAASDSPTTEADPRSP